MTDMKNTLEAVGSVWSNVVSRRPDVYTCRQLHTLVKSAVSLRSLVGIIKKKSVPNYLRRHIHLPDGVVCFCPVFFTV